jgi:alpha-L-arabinofuranosidase
LLRHADRVKIACMAQLINTIAPIMTETGGKSWCQTTYYPFLHASLFGRGTVLQPVIQSPTYEVKIERSPSWWMSQVGRDKKATKDIPYLETIAVANGDELTIFAVNKHLSEALDFSCEIRGAEGYAVTEHIIMSNKDLKAKNTAADPFKVIPESTGNAKAKSDKVNASLPACSWNVIRLSKKK